MGSQVYPEKETHPPGETPFFVVEELDMIIEACNTNGLQLMDSTMWMHYPRTHKMKQLLENPDLFGNLKSVSIQSRLIMKKLGLKR